MTSFQFVEYYACMKIRSLYSKTCYFVTRHGCEQSLFLQKFYIIACTTHFYLKNLVLVFEQGALIGHLVHKLV